jgi:hypothetical protein
VNDTIKDDPDGKWLQEGISKVLEFGIDVIEEFERKSFVLQAKTIFKSKGIRYE